MFSQKKRRRVNTHEMDVLIHLMGGILPLYMYVKPSRGTLEIFCNFICQFKAEKTFFLSNNTM